eukprot:s828_g29.t1
MAGVVWWQWLMPWLQAAALRLSDRTGPAGLALPLVAIGPDRRFSGKYANMPSFLQSDGRHILVRSGDYEELPKIAAAVAEAALPWSELFVSARILPGDLGYDGTFLAMNRMLQELGAPRIDLVLVSSGEKGERQAGPATPPCAQSEFGWELCAKSSLAALEHLQLSGKVAHIGAHDWSVQSLQTLSPVLRAPLAALELTFDTFANSHLAALKLGLIKGIQIMMIGFAEQPGRLISPMFIGAGTQSEAYAGRASMMSAFATLSWLVAKDVVAVMPGDLLDSASISALQSLDGENLMHGHLRDYFDTVFWPGERRPILYEAILELGTTCPGKLKVSSPGECMVAMEELQGPSALAPDMDGTSKASGCSLHFGVGCQSIDCAVAHFGDAGRTAGQPRAVPVCQIDRARPPSQGRTLFLSMCMGAEYFDKFCAPFLASFRMVYGGLLHGWHTMRVWTVGVGAQQLQHARDLFAPAGVEFEESSSEELHRRFVEEYGRSADVDYLSEEIGSPGLDGRTGCFGCQGFECTCDPGAHDEKVVFNNIYFLQWVISQFEAASQNEGYQYMVFIDSDMLFLQDLGRFLPREPETTDWEYAFTIYDKDHEVPWGSNEEVAKTRNGFVRINSGVQLFRYTEGVRLFLSNLLKITRIFMRYGETKQLAEETWFLEEFRALNQAAIAWFVGSANLLYNDCLVCWPRTISFDSVSATGEQFSLSAQGLPARFINQAESVTDGLLSREVHMVHLKGLWWRVLILNATAHSTATRCFAWNTGAYDLWKSLYLAWRPELVVTTSVHQGQQCPDVASLTASF